MCKAQNEGGQRCAAHAKAAIAKAEDRYDSSGKEEDLQSVVSAYVQYASTSEGFDAMTAKIASGEPGPGDLPAGMWERIQHDGSELRRRNTEIAQAVREATAKGDAFHADVKAKLAGPFRYVPEGVRGPKSLDKYLDNEQHKMRWASTAFVEDLQTAERLDAVLKTVQNAPLTPNAAFEDRLPRSEEERAAWVENLTQKRDFNANMGNDRQKAVVDHNEAMAKFGRQGWEADRSKVVPPLDTQGALVRLRGADGTESEQEYIVWRVTDNDARANGVTTVMVLPLNEIENGRCTDHGPKALMPEKSFRGQVTDKIGDTVITPERLAPASPETIAKIGSARVETAEDRYITEVGPSEYHHTVRVWSIGGREEAQFDEFRAEWARKNSPYKAPKATKAVGEDRLSLGDRMKSIFTG